MSTVEAPSFEQFKREFETREPIIGQIRTVQTLKGKVNVYKNAEITLKRFNPEHVFPSAKYVLWENLNNVGDIATQLRQEGKDIFNLRGLTQFNGGVIAPPVVEESDGVPTIVDGQHRFWWALSTNQPITAIYIKGATLPIISYPVDWSEVKMYNTKPEDPTLLRNLREGIPDESSELRKYYRDFNWMGSGGRRPRAGQTS